MNIDYGNRAWTAEGLQTLRDSVRAEIATGQVSQAQVSRESAVASSTLSQFLAGNYAGNNNGPANLLARWLDARLRAAELLNTAPPQPTFVETPTAVRVMTALQHARVMGDMVVITGVPGVGKTAAAKAFKQRSAAGSVVLIAGSPSIKSTSAVMRAIIASHGIDRMSATSAAELSAGVRTLFDDTKLLVVDEAQHLTMDALEELRAIHDARGCGLALMGNYTVLSRIEGNAREAAFGQMFSRVGWRVHIEKQDANDVAAVLETMGIRAAETIAACQIIAAKDSLRTVVKAVRGALMLAMGARENLSPRHLQAAYRLLGGKASLAPAPQAAAAAEMVA